MCQVQLVSVKIKAPLLASSNQIYLQFLNMSSALFSQMEDARKRELMQRKPTSNFLDFDDTRLPSWDQLQFTPPQPSRETNPASQDDNNFERD